MTRNRARWLPILVPLSALALALVALAPRLADGQEAGFWDRLAACESENGRTSGNLFQFTPDTWAKVTPGPATPEEASDAQQYAAAADWADQVDPGSSAGWPVCWHVAAGDHGATASSPSPAEEWEAEAAEAPVAPAPTPPPAPAPDASPARVALTG